MGALGATDYGINIISGIHGYVEQKFQMSFSQIKMASDVLLVTFL